MRQVELYNDKLDFDVNKAQGPFGVYADCDTPYQNTGEPSYDFFGEPVYSPFGIAAGPLPTTRFIGAALCKGYDIVTLKSVRTDTFPLNPFPQVTPLQLDGSLDPKENKPIKIANEYKQPLAVANSFGIPSVKPEVWQPEMKKSFELPKKGQALLVAFQGTARGEGREAFVQDHVKGIELIRQTGAKVIEINLSCPNEGEETLACFDIDISGRIIEAVRSEFPDLKLLFKIAYFSDKKLLEEFVGRVGDMLDGISAINTIAAPIIDKDGKEFFPGRPKAGVSGAPIKQKGLEMTEALYKLRDKLGHSYNILSMGGVLSAADFHDYQQAGADYVMSVTGAMWNPNLAAEVKASL